MNGSVLIGLVPTWLTAWLTPVWLVGVGALAGLLVLLLLWGLLWLVARRAAREIPLAITEGALLPILLVTGAAALFGAVGTPIVSQPAEIFASALRIPFVGSWTREFVIAAPTGDDSEDQFQSINVAEFRGSELREVIISSNSDLAIRTSPIAALSTLAFSVAEGEEFRWSRGVSEESPLEDRPYDQLFVLNQGEGEAVVNITLVTASAYPEVITILITAVSVVAIVFLYLVLRVSMPKISAIALATAKSEMAQPLFLILLVSALFLLILSAFIPYYTFGEDIKMLKNWGLTWIMLSCVFEAVWAASTSVAEEIDGRTALTVLSKPVGRRQFVLGKFLGIIWVVAVMFILMGIIFLIVVAYKPVFEAREASEAEPTWQMCHADMILTVPGLVLAFLETVVLASLSVAISTRLPLLPNFLICFAIYAAGHLTPLIVQSSLGEFEPVQFVGQLIATVLPVLDHFNIYAAIAAGVAVPVEYLATALLYCVLYSTVAMLLALVLFEDRDLA